MKTKTLAITLFLWLIVLSAISCTDNEEWSDSSPEITVEKGDERELRLTATQTTAVTPRSGPTDPRELESFLDAYFAEQMPALHVPGATIFLVKDGEILFAKGYGYADLEHQIPYDPAETIFWAASITKIFSVVGVLQLYEKGLIHLEDDVNQYLLNFQIPDDYPQPVTFRHLLTHTDGFEARIIGDAARTPAELRSLQAVVRGNLPERIAPPGEFLTYGNYRINLSGALLEDIFGLPFAAYMESNIFQPLDMQHTTFVQTLPPDWVADLAVGYGYDDGVNTDDDGRIAYLFSGQKYHGTYRKIAWYEAPALHFALPSVSAFFFLVTLIFRPVQAWYKRRRSAARPSTFPKMARWLTGAICALHLVFIAAVSVVMGNFVDVIYGVPPLLRIALALPLLAAILTAAQTVMVAQAWRRKIGSTWERSYYTLLTVIALAFTWWLDYWNLLGFRY